jgi:hypothetical protein
VWSAGGNEPGQEGRTIQQTLRKTQSAPKAEATAAEAVRADEGITVAVRPAAIQQKLQKPQKIAE